MNRTLIPGEWNHAGQAVRSDMHRCTLTALPFCTGNCRGGRSPCNCATGYTELSNEVALRQEFPAPERTREDDAYRAHALCWVLVVDAMALAAMCALIYFF